MKRSLGLGINTIHWLLTLREPSSFTSSFVVDTILAQLNWTDTNVGSAQYEVYSSTNGADYVLLTTTALGATSYQDTTCKQNASVVYKIRAKKGDKFTDYVAATALATPLCWKSDQSILTTHIINTLNITAGKSVTVNYSDGTSQAYSGNNSNITKNFAETGQYNIWLTGDTNSITSLTHENQSKSYGAINNWVLPETLVNFYVYSTQVSGDISGWVLPATLVNFYVRSTQVSGDISGWVLPATLVNFYVYSTQVSGDISGWVLPATLVDFNVRSTQVSGDISGWVLPATLVNFSVHSTQISGVLPQITAHATNAMSYLAYSIYIYDSNVTVFRKAMTSFNISNQNVTFSTANIDKLLKAIADWYEVNAPTANCTFTMNGANMGIPTDGALNADISRIMGYYTAASKTATIVVRTS